MRLSALAAVTTPVFKRGSTRLFLSEASVKQNTGCGTNLKEPHHVAVHTIVMVRAEFQVPLMSILYTIVVAARYVIHDTVYMDMHVSLTILMEYVYTCNVLSCKFVRVVFLFRGVNGCVCVYIHVRLGGPKRTGNHSRHVQTPHAQGGSVGPDQTC